MNVKRGDPIKTEVSGTTCFYDGFVESYGTASRAIRHMCPRDFGFDIEK